MKVTYDFDLANFQAWSGAVATKNTIIESGMTEAFESLLEEIFPDGASETEINDYMWFDDEQIFEMLGITEEEEEEEF